MTVAAETAAAETAIIGIAQWLPIPGEMERNEQTARAAVADLAARGADLVVLPEMWLTGYDPGRLAEHSRRAAQPLDGPLVTRLRMWAREQSVMVCAGTIPELAGSDVYNTAVLIDADGEVLTAHRKVHLYRPGGEDIAFAAGSSLRVVQTSRLGRVGVLVCFDGDFFESAHAGAGQRPVVGHGEPVRRQRQHRVPRRQPRDRAGRRDRGRPAPDRIGRSRVPGHRDQARAATPRRATGSRRPAH